MVNRLSLIGVTASFRATNLAGRSDSRLRSAKVEPGALPQPVRVVVFDVVRLRAARALNVVIGGRSIVMCSAGDIGKLDRHGAVAELDGPHQASISLSVPRSNAGRLSEIASRDSAHAGLALSRPVGSRCVRRPPMRAGVVRVVAGARRIGLRTSRPRKTRHAHGVDQPIYRRMTGGRALPVTRETKQDLTTPLGCQCLGRNRRGARDRGSAYNDRFQQDRGASAVKLFDTLLWILVQEKGSGQIRANT